MTTSTHTTESALLVEKNGHWELYEVEQNRFCFSAELVPGKLLASGSMKACEAAAKFLGYHIDIIKTVKP